MSFCLRQDARNPDEPEDERRTTGRRKQYSLYCNYGPVLDISAGGARVLATKALKGNINIEFYSNVGQLAIPAEVIWTERVGFRKHEVGFIFTEVSDETITYLSQMSSAHKLPNDNAA